ncbi:hypothetical protein [Aeromonas enteropelogenes]|uniref:hypothetical protein n=1 Tax=Aeromonas enteropelogenes TaxID=29489 RepID=UPI003BA16309
MRVLNKEYSINIIDGNQQLLWVLLSEYLVLAPNLYQTLNTAIKEECWTDIAKAAHSLRTALIHFDVWQLDVLVFELECAALRLVRGDIKDADNNELLSSAYSNTAEIINLTRILDVEIAEWLISIKG